MKHSTTLLSLTRDKIHYPYYYAHLETKQELWRREQPSVAKQEVNFLHPLLNIFSSYTLSAKVNILKYVIALKVRHLH